MLTIKYRNWKGVVSERQIVPHKVVLKYSTWHSPDADTPVWIMEALDVTKGEMRDFHMLDILEFKNSVFQ